MSTAGQNEACLCPDVQRPAQACVQGPQKVLGMIQTPPCPQLASGLPPPTGPPSLFLTVLSPSRCPHPPACLRADHHVTSPLSNLPMALGPLRTKSKPFNKTGVAILSDDPHQLLQPPLSPTCICDDITHAHTPPERYTPHTHTCSHKPHTQIEAQRYTHHTHIHTSYNIHTYVPETIHTHTPSHTHTQMETEIHTPHSDTHTCTHTHTPHHIHIHHRGNTHIHIYHIPTYHRHTQAYTDTQTHHSNSMHPTHTPCCFSPLPLGHLS